MAVITPTVIDSLQIENFIYHVIRHDLDEPSFNDEVSLEQEQGLIGFPGNRSCY
jgi:hypothetical protein